MHAEPINPPQTITPLEKRNASGNKEYTASVLTVANTSDTSVLEVL